MFLNRFYTVQSIALKETLNYMKKDQFWQLKYFITGADFIPVRVNRHDVPLP